MCVMRRSSMAPPQAAPRLSAGRGACSAAGRAELQGDRLRTALARGDAGLDDVRPGAHTAELEARLALALLGLAVDRPCHAADDAAPGTHRDGPTTRVETHHDL